ncbi:Spore coat protein SA [compost metagenome]
MIEAMALGRTVIVSTAGGNSEIIENGINGFIGDATEKDFERSMDEAWENRDKWDEIGKTACLHIENNFPASPERVFANSINQFLI